MSEAFLIFLMVVTATVPIILFFNLSSYVRSVLNIHLNRLDEMEDDIEKGRK